MVEQSGIIKIKQFKNRWIGYQLLADVGIAAAVALFAGSILCTVFAQPLWLAPLLFIAMAIGLLLLRQSWKITDTDVSRYLNTAYPELEESCELAISTPDSLNLLQNLQRGKVIQTLSNIKQPAAFTKRLKTAGLLFLLALLLSVIISKVNYRYKASLGANVSSSSNPALKNLPPEKLLPGVKSVNLKITPPGYTGKAPKYQDRFSVIAEEASEVSWLITTNIAVGKVQFIVNEKEIVNLHPVNSQKTQWTAQRQLNNPGFYQVKIADKLSDYYKIEIIKDAPPAIRVKTPKQYTYIDAGESTKVLLSVSVNDDYGISDGFIFATIAKGSGESVKFKEQKINFAELFASHQKQYNLQKIIDLHALTMEPGDELYFYIQAQDNHQQQTRTDVYIITIQDTAQLLSMTNTTLGVSLVPEYFRSERQIILDTEKLLKDRDSISAEAFKTRCNNLGYDQKLLRLRYGKFLGEEEESAEGGLKDADALSNPADFSNTQKILDAYTDKHDNAEDAGFLEKDSKSQLKNTLNEMWKAELKLRTFNPQEALPFEYKALRLLKDLQQKSRAYVAKTAYNPPPLKLAEKRLSADLSKIIQPLSHRDIKQSADAFESLKKAVAILDELKRTRALSSTDISALQMASLQLSNRAAAQPSVYLPAITAMHHILGANAQVKLSDILKVETALQKALPAAGKLPQSGQINADMGLAQSYYKNLSRNK